MARRKKGNPVHGWVVLDKPLNMTSTQAVALVKRLFDAQKAGHAGTLDPLATGVLPIALGEATKTMSYVVDGEKAYRFTVRWGVETTTDDAEGEVQARSDLRPTRAEIEALLGEFTGEILQVPPQFSAIKVDGQRAYDLARDGEAVALEARPVVIHELEITDMPDADTTVFEAVCGKGTYVRAIARDIGRRLGCRGHVIALRRMQVGPFVAEASVTPEELGAERTPEGGMIARRPAALGADGADDVVEDGEAEDGGAAVGGAADAFGHLLPVEAALDDLIGLSVSQGDAARIRRGQSIILRGRDAPIHTGAAYALQKGRLVALGEIEGAEFRPTRVFNLGG